MEKMTAQEAAEWGKTLDFPTVWAAMMKSDEKLDKLGERIDRQSANIDKMRERSELEAWYEKTRVEFFNSLSMGELIETLFGPHLGDKFDVYNYNLKRIRRRVPIYDDNNWQRGEIDILLSNTALCMAMEVKRWMDENKLVYQHIKRMQLIRQYPPEEVKGKKLLGAMLGAVVTPEAREYAEQNGLFVLELTGENVLLLEPPNGFQPKEW
jgi:hypothetical protein